MFNHIRGLIRHGNPLLAKKVYYPWFLPPGTILVYGCMNLIPVQGLLMASSDNYTFDYIRYFEC